ncbi:MAG: class I SAM-dependent rRNA methyltransferase [Kiritimatiellae bacterium]|nr:class I SAM-dependent rRNA methyltransferase [Kiritimatiellia bacterium]
MNAVTLRPGREKSVLRRHPWIFSGAVSSVEGDPAPGAAVAVRSARGETLGAGFWSPASAIRVRMVSFGPEPAAPDAAWLRERLEAAWARRAAFRAARPGRDAFRAVHGESDGLPGLVVDRYADVLCAQILAPGFERMRGDLAAALLDVFPRCTAVFERSDAPARVREGLEPRTGPLALRPGAPEPDFSAVEISPGGGVRAVVDLAGGQKTGSYLDQAENHARVGALAAGRDVLDACCYDGGFTLAALRGGARSVLALDASETALGALGRNLALNGLGQAPVERLRGDLFEKLRAFRDARRSFDLVVLDPPKFADSRARVERACRAYKDVNLLAFKLLRPGGLLATFSCSGAVDAALFETVVAEAASDAGRDAAVVARFDQPPDHPVALACPETRYLKGLLCAV